MKGNFFWFAPISLFCLAMQTVFAQESDSLCDKWFTEHSDKCGLGFYSKGTWVEGPCLNPIRFPPNCVSNESKITKDYAKYLWEKAGVYSGIFNRSMDAVVIGAIVDFYKAAEQRQIMFNQALRENRFEDAAFIVLDDMIPGDTVAMGRHADKFYSDLHQGHYFEALKNISHDTTQVVIDSALGPVKRGASWAKTAVYDVSVPIIEYAIADMRRLDLSSKNDRSFYGALSTQDYGRAAKLAGSNAEKGVAGKSVYYMSPLASPSKKSVEINSTNRSSLKNESSYEQIVGTPSPFDALRPYF